MIAKELRVSVRSVERWHRAWREDGMAVLRSAGPATSLSVTGAQVAVFEEELGKRPTRARFRRRAVDSDPGPGGDPSQSAGALFGGDGAALLKRHG
ncbi:hypothetical protein ACFXPT_39400 [Streptomyces goshikiensis]|uniref:hypothetical protein n=1 Tax=Streptomyces goshikiensis TaxID=1942 RepID=UPI0036B52D15